MKNVNEVSAKTKAGKHGENVRDTISDGVSLQDILTDDISNVCNEKESLV